MVREVRQVRQVLIITLLLLAAAASGVYLFGGAIGADARKAAAREAAARLAWERELGDPADRLKAFPATEASDAARRLVAAMQPMSLNAIDQQLRASTSSYLNKESDKAGGPVDALPEIVEAYLESNQARLDATIDASLNYGPIVWRGDASRLIADGARRDFDEVRALQPLLVARAFSQAGRARLREAEETLLASWTINASVRNRPEILSQLIAMAALGHHAGAIRRIAVDPEPWRRRLAEHDHRQAYLNAAEMEANAMFNQLPSGTSPIFQATRADYLEAMMPFLVNLRNAALDDRRQDAGAPVDAAASGSIGLAAAETLKPGVFSALSLVGQLALELELANRVLAAREHKSRTGRWPDGGTFPSRVKDAEWISAIAPDGRLTISLNRRHQPPKVRFEARR